MKSHNLHLKFLSHIQINAKNSISRVGQALGSLGFRFLLGGYTPTLTNTHHLLNGIKNFQVINVFKCETKNFNDSYDK
jgi:hypothetical protein